MTKYRLVRIARDGHEYSLLTTKDKVKAEKELAKHQGDTLYRYKIEEYASKG